MIIKNFALAVLLIFFSFSAFANDVTCEPGDLVSKWVFGHQYCGCYDCQMISGRVYCGNCSMISGQVYCGKDECSAEGFHVICDGKVAEPANVASYGPCQ